MLWTWEFGRQIEWKQSSLSLVLLFTFIATISNLAQYFHSGPLFGGMSGVVYGLLGYLWMHSLFDPKSGLQVKNEILWMLIGWLVICYTGILDQLLGTSIANTAHSVGLLAGVFFALTRIGFTKFIRR